MPSTHTTSSRLLRFLIFLCVAQAALLVLLARMAWQAFDRHNDVRLDPVGEMEAGTLAKAHGAHPWVLLGDSHAAFWPMPNAVNLGIPNQTSAQIALRAELISGRISGERMLISAGANDLKTLATNPTQKDEIVTSCLNHIERIISIHTPHFQSIILMTIPPRFAPPLHHRLLNRPEIDAAHLEINEGIRRLATTHNLRLLDAYTLLSSAPTRLALSSDGIHLSPTAYTFLTKTLHHSP